MNSFLRVWMLLSFSLMVAVSCGDVEDLGENALEFTDTTPQNVTLRWRAPSLNVDQSPLTDLQEFRIYASKTPGTYQENNLQTSVPANSNSGGNEQQATFQLQPGAYYFVLTAVDQFDNESGYSNEICHTVSPTSELCP